MLEVFLCQRAHFGNLYFCLSLPHFWSHCLNQGAMTLAVWPNTGNKRLASRKTSLDHFLQHAYCLHKLIPLMFLARHDSENTRRLKEVWLLSWSPALHVWIQQLYYTLITTYRLFGKTGDQLYSDLSPYDENWIKPKVPGHITR